MATLSDDIKLFIVNRLACFDTPQEVADEVNEEFGIKIDRNQTSLYDPTKAKGKTLGKKYRAIFDSTRKKFLDEMAELPLAHASVRVRELTKMFNAAKKLNNRVMASQLLEQIAKETGGAYTNKIKLTGGDKGDEPVKVESQTTSRLMILREKKVKKAEDVAG